MNSQAEVDTFNSAAKKETLTQVYKPVDWILMHPNSVPSQMLGQHHTCSSIKMDSTVFPSAPQAQQLDPLMATQISR
jgi:hypothetical protein